MPPAPRKQPNPTRPSRTTRNEASGALQRRLRQGAARLDWLDVVAGAILGQLLDAVGGEGDMSHVHEFLHLLLDLF